MMHRGRFIGITSLGFVLATRSRLYAQMASPKPLSPHADAAEKAFIAQATRFVQTHYASTQKASAAGFVRFTNEDKTGAISWANRNWTSTDADHPSQVWYDANGRLIGVDYSVLQANSPQAPKLWGINPGRWITIHAHIHYGLNTPSGVEFHGMGAAKFTDAGGSLASPTKQTLVNMGIAKSASDVAFVFLFPSIWDLQFWVIPNADGEFADYNPAIKARDAKPHPM